MLEAKVGVGYWLLLSILTFDAGLQPLPVQGPGHKKRVLKCRFQDFRPGEPDIKCQLEQIQSTTDSNLPSHKLCFIHHRNQGIINRAYHTCEENTEYLKAFFLRITTTYNHFLNRLDSGHRDRLEQLAVKCARSDPLFSSSEVLELLGLKASAFPNDFFLKPITIVVNHAFLHHIINGDEINLNGAGYSQFTSIISMYQSLIGVRYFSVSNKRLLVILSRKHYAIGAYFYTSFHQKRRKNPKSFTITRNRHRSNLKCLKSALISLCAQQGRLHEGPEELPDWD